MVGHKQKYLLVRCIVENLSATQTIQRGKLPQITTHRLDFDAKFKKLSNIFFFTCFFFLKVGFLKLFSSQLQHGGVLSVCVSPWSYLSPSLQVRIMYVIIFFCSHLRCHFCFRVHRPVARRVLFHGCFAFSHFCFSFW